MSRYPNVVKQLLDDTSWSTSLASQSVTPWPDLQHTLPAAAPFDVRAHGEGWLALVRRIPDAGRFQRYCFSKMYQLEPTCWCRDVSLPNFAIHRKHCICVLQVGDFGLRMTGPGGSSVILPVDISLSGASYLCIIGAPNRQPPYRIDNRHATP
jgi:hypothetical protein